MLQYLLLIISPCTHLIYFVINVSLLSLIKNNYIHLVCITHFLQSNRFSMDKIKFNPTSCFLLLLFVDGNMAIDTDITKRFDIKSQALDFILICLDTVQHMSVFH